MRVAAKAINDFFVALLKAQVVFYARLRKQGCGLRMHQRGLAVHVGHVGKDALGHRQAAVLRAGHQLLRQHQGQGILRKGTGRVAVHIARELVQHNDLRQPPLWRGAPVKQLAPRCGLQRGTKAGADGFVQGSVFGEVLLVGQLFKPEVEDGLGLYCGRGCFKKRRLPRCLTIGLEGASSRIDPLRQHFEFGYEILLANSLLLREVPGIL